MADPLAEYQISPALRAILGGKAIKAVARQAGAQALEEWRRRDLPRRFRADAFQAYGYSARGKSYSRWGAKLYGQPIAYYAPRSRKRPRGPHMRDLLQTDTGVEARSHVQGGGVVVIRLIMPATRPLNTHAVYRNEFLGWGRGRGRLESIRLRRRALDLLWNGLGNAAFGGDR
jgi:hypothetical protein